MKKKIAAIQWTNGRIQRVNGSKKKNQEEERKCCKSEEILNYLNE